MSRTIFSCLAVLASLCLVNHSFAQGTGGPGGPGGPGGGGNSIVVDSISDSFISPTITVSGWADPNLHSQVTVNLLTLPGAPCVDGLMMTSVGNDVATVDPVSGEWEVTFTQGGNAVNPFTCVPTHYFLDGPYRANATDSGAGDTSNLFCLRVDCVIGVGSFSCCDPCWYLLYCSVPCDSLGIFPGGPFCW